MPLLLSLLTFVCCLLEQGRLLELKAKLTQQVGVLDSERRFINARAAALQNKAVQLQACAQQTTRSSVSPQLTLLLLFRLRRRLCFGSVRCLAEHGCESYRAYSPLSVHGLHNKLD